MIEKEKRSASNIINVQGSFKWMKKIYFIPLWISQIYEFVISFAWIIPLCFSVQRLILTLDPILYFRMFECERRFLISFDYWIQIDVNGNKMENRKRKIHCIRIKLWWHHNISPNSNIKDNTSNTPFIIRYKRPIFYDILIHEREKFRLCLFNSGC